MLSVDKADAWINAYLPFPHHKNKWTRAFMFHSYKTALVNAWIIWKHQTASQATNKKDADRCMSLTQVEFLQKFLFAQNLWANLHKHSARHMHHPHPAKKDGRCEYCNKIAGTNKHSKTSFYCPGCKVKLHAKCFMSYHQYKRIF
ncbi:hypothetical protein AKO1_002735 [Acrasis kona]|uniref:Phorbol-ester/DAG-type domain-containing protein n=1 Tax=Acrasis kona TaxID=1008807 RepID=A0AAW2ZH15_9EUKA